MTQIDFAVHAASRQAKQQPQLVQTRPVFNLGILHIDLELCASLQLHTSHALCASERSALWEGTLTSLTYSLGRRPPFLIIAVLESSQDLLGGNVGGGVGGNVLTIDDQRVSID